MHGTRMNSLSHPTAAPPPLGQLPEMSQISTVPLLSSPPAAASRVLTSQLIPHPLRIPNQLCSESSSLQRQGPVVISPAFPPIPAKLAAKILSGAYVEMRELLPDNIMLRRQLEIQDEFAPSPSQPKPPLREVQSITSWVCCMVTYLAVLAKAGRVTADHLAYVRLVVSEAAKYKGDGWRAYDATFRQNVAAQAPGMHWSRLDAGLHAVSFQSMRPVASTTAAGCSLCWEPDHATQDCALQTAVNARQRTASKLRSRSPGPGKPPYPTVCYSWNSGACVRFPNSCKFEHICSKCARGGARRPHKAVDCRTWRVAEQVDRTTLATSQPAGQSSATPRR